VFGQIQAARPGCRYTDAVEPRRQFTFLFYVTDNCGESVIVCKQALLSIFGLQNSRGRINNLTTQIVSGSRTSKSDNRGKHHNRRNYTESSILDDVINHTDSFPKYESHYSRKDNTGRKYLGSELSINTLYDLYVAQCMSRTKVGRLQVLDATVNADRYIKEVLEPRLLSSARDIFGEGQSFVFQQDGVPCHTAKMPEMV